MKIWIHWNNEDGTVQKMRFQNIPRGLRWRRKVWILKRGYKAVKKCADKSGPAEMSQSIQFYQKWVSLAADFFIKHNEHYTPRDLKKYFRDALQWLSNHQVGEI